MFSAAFTSLGFMEGTFVALFLDRQLGGHLWLANSAQTLKHAAASGWGFS